MKIIYSNLAKSQLNSVKEYISIYNEHIAKSYLLKIKEKIEILANFPYLGKINSTMNLESIREIVVEGYKVIYQITDTAIYILTVYKYIDFDETEIEKELQ